MPRAVPVSGSGAGRPLGGRMAKGEITIDRKKGKSRA